jgi:putative methyltransferase
MNLALVLVHDLLFAKGIQAGDGPVKQAVLRHKYAFSLHAFKQPGTHTAVRTRLKGELQKLKIKRGARLDSELSSAQDERAGENIQVIDGSLLLWLTCATAKIPRYARINTNICTHEAAIKSLLAGGYAPGDPFSSR